MRLSLPFPGTASRRYAALVLLVLVLGLHLGLAERMLDAFRLGEGAARREQALRRIEVAFVQELRPQAPPAQPPAPVRPRRVRPTARAPSPSASAASAPETAASATVAAAIAAAVLPEPVPEMPPAPVSTLPEAMTTLPDAGAGAAATAASAASDSKAAPFEWPPSTRLSYTLTGDYRGPVHGNAQVEWLRSGNRYQVHLDVTVGPFMARRMSSEGELTEAGLKPLRYEEETRMLTREPRRVRIEFQNERTLLAGGREAAPLPGMQDTASQFVQLTWMFTTQPQRLLAGQVIEMPLALPRRVETWIYDVVGEERLSTPAGEIGAVYLKPRREARAGGDLVVETWIAPTLQYLPVRIRIRQDAQTYVDLLIERLPQQAAEPVPAAR